MSVYRPAGSPFYYFDFQWRGHRFYGPTKLTSRREAETFERAERDRAKQQVAQAFAVTGSLKLEDIVVRYWSEIGQHHAGEKDTWRDLCRLVDYFGATKSITDITDNDVAKLVAWRRGHRVIRKPGKKVEEYPLISNATVNRSTTLVLKKLFTRAATAWGVRFENPPRWRHHFLPEAEERIRELVGDEGERLEEATRDDYLPFFAFAHSSGLRLESCLLRWSEVDWAARQIRKPGKGGRLVTVPITDTIREILEPLQGHHVEMVFTYVAARTDRRKGLVKGNRYPVTYSGAKTAFKRLRKRAGVVGFRLHDYRHDHATKLLRETGNLKLVQKALNHRNIKTTLRYAHVLDEEVATAMERVAKSRKKSRNQSRKAS